MQDALNKLCRYYKSDQIAEGRYVIQNILGKNPHLHHTETRVGEWGYEIVVSCDNCGQQETQRGEQCRLHNGGSYARQA